MSVSTDLQTIAENVPLVYAAGKQKQYDDFWDAFQQGGTRTNYQYAFSGNGFTSEFLSPKYPIPTIANNNAGRYMFALNTVLTQITFPLSFSADTNANVFNGASALISVAEVTVTSNVAFSGWFTGCSALESIMFSGTIGQTISFASSSRLNVQSAKSVLSHLSTSGSGKTVTFASAIQSAVEADAEAVTLIATARTNGWTINFS